MKILLWLATGGGKSVIFSNLLKSIYDAGLSCLFIVRRRDLVFQARDKHLHPKGIPCSIIMGSEKGFDPNESIQIASIDTIIKRDVNMKYDFIIVDEAHDTTSKKYREFLDKLEFKACIGLTATPFRVGSKVHDWWDICVKPIEMRELRDQGFLVPARVYAPSKIDTSDIKKSAGDYNNLQLFKRVSEMKIIGDIVSTYKKYGQNLPAILFAVNIEHSSLMATAFSQEGIPAMHCDQSHSQAEREHAINMLKNGTIKILCNVNIFSTGVDIPNAVIGIMARPTLSETLYVQQVGRLLRPFKICKCGREVGAEDCHGEYVYIKKNALIFDHADNTSRHGLPYTPREAEMETRDKKVKMEKGEPEIKTCTECFAVYDTGFECPYCGHKKEVKKSETKEESGELKEVQEKDIIMQQMAKDWSKWIYREGKFKVSKYQKFKMLHKKYGDIAFEFVEFPQWITREIIKDEFLRRTSKIIEANYAGSAKVVS